MSYARYSEALLTPDVIRLEGSLHVAFFELMKMVPAHGILEAAREEGRLGEGSRVVESSSGSFAIGLAICAAERGYRLTIVTDPLMEPIVTARLESLGVELDVIPGPEPACGWQTARLERVRELVASDEGWFWPRQYSNPENRRSYAQAAAHIAAAMGVPDVLVGSVGSGGSLCGIGEHLALGEGEPEIVAVDVPGSRVFGAPPAARLLRGVGNSIVPANVVFELIDEVHWVPTPEAVWAVRELERTHGIWAGGSGGAAWLVASWIATRAPDRTVVCILPDHGYRYAETLYSAEWLERNGVDVPARRPEPAEVSDPGEIAGRWSRMRWGRRGRGARPEPA